MIQFYDEKLEIYRDCRFCGGRGCLACPAEADKAYHAAFPGGPKPIATIKIEEIGQLKDVLGPDAMRRYFGAGDLGGEAFERDLTQRLAEIRAASGTEAQRATTVEQGVVHDGPVGDSRDAQPKVASPLSGDGE